MNWVLIFNFLTCWIFSLSISYYLMINLQWYNYSFYRVFTKHHKFLWHIFYFFAPTLLFIITGFYTSQIVFYGFSILFYFLFFPYLLLWIINLDKKLQFTRRVKTFFGILFLFLLLHQITSIILKATFHSITFIIPVVLAFFISSWYEKILFNRYLALAKSKVNHLKDLKIIAVTGSFGKTSIKNFLEQILSVQYQVYATPRSVNTIKGIVSDVNENLQKNIQIYIAEAGARQKGDIKEIAQLLNPHYAIIGEIGAQHIEYFKTIENITQTKFELLESKRLQKAFIYQANPLPQDIQKNKVTLYPDQLKDTEATLDKTSFSLKIDGVFYPFETNVLGTFNIANLSVAILMAHELKIPIPTIQKIISNIKPIPHRLQKSVARGKIILDDSFNGNLNGMLEAIRIASLYEGRKIIITPGLVESDLQSNIALAKAIDEVFDLAIITGDLNSKILSNHIKNPQKIILKNKSQLENILLTSTHKGDLLLFANDAPNFI